MPDERPLITEDWLRTVGFKWHQFDRQPAKQWLLWLTTEGIGYEDLGLELAPGYDGEWFCWLRSDSAHRYHRFIHIRHLRYCDEVTLLFVGLTGQDWDPSNHIAGSARTPEAAARYRAEWDRIDRRLLRSEPRWSEVEKDDTRGGALPEHVEFHAKQRERDST